MSVAIEKLIAYADGELPPEERAQVERALAADGALREKLAAQQRLRANLSHAFDGVLSEPAPDRLREILEPTPACEAAPAPAEVIGLAERRTAKWSAREWGALAASFAAGLAVAFGALSANTPMIVATDGGLAARGPLATALETQLAADNDAGPVRIGLTFRDPDGDYCRTFDLTRNDTSGLACRADGGWSVELTAAHAGGGDVRMAGAAPAVLSAVEGRIAGEPLDAAAEARARAAGWR